MPSPAERYLDLARQGKNQWWRYVLGVFTILISTVISMLLLGGLAGIVYGLFVGAEQLEAQFSGAKPLNPLLYFVALNFSILAMLPGLAVTMKFIHGRSLHSLITPDRRIDWRRMAYSAAVWFVLVAAATALEHVLFPGRYTLSFNAERFLPFLALVLVLTPLQAAVEELVFRGYLMQAFGVLIRSPVFVAIASSVAFVAPHLMNPEVAQHGALVMAAYYFAFGMLAAAAALRDGRLELAMGIHAANNVFTGVVANYEGSALPTESIFMARVMDPVYGLAAFVICAVVFYWWMFRRSAPAGGVSEGPVSDTARLDSARTGTTD